jgi:hypothetical protein
VTDRTSFNSGPVKDPAHIGYRWAVLQDRMKKYAAVQREARSWVKARLRERYGLEGLPRDCNSEKFRKRLSFEEKISEDVADVVLEFLASAFERAVIANSIQELASHLPGVSVDTMRKATQFVEREGFWLHIPLGRLTSEGRAVAAMGDSRLTTRDGRSWIWVSPVFGDFGYLETTPQR